MSLALVAASSSSSSLYSSIASTTITKCVPRPTSATSAGGWEFPTRIGRPAYSASYSTIDTFSTTTSSSSSSSASSSCDESSISSSSVSETDEASFTRNPFMATEGLTLDLQARYIGIVCTTGECQGTGDWLVKEPNAAAAWAIGALSLLLGLWFLIPTFKWQSRGFFRGTFAMLLVAVSLFLRAMVGRSQGGTQERVFRVSVQFNYYAGLFLCNLVLIMLLRLSGHVRPVTGKWRYLVAVVKYGSLYLMIGLVIGAMVTVFSDTGEEASNAMGGVSARLLQAALGLVLLQCVAIVIAVSGLARKESGRYLLRQVVTVLCCSGCVLLWAAFMLARTFVVLSNPARSSEVMYYLLGVAPLILAVTTMVVLSAPLSFNFQMTSNWKWNNRI
ncbi:hypothetical protein LPJ64_002223 [Coemansia asiatica]|uniref:Uncharacterized protein n=1 Tax=Coemansia asiatica TaxID=1052880 RepID=A0A9W7XP46_9FUNG|nr:hypothetical protein LPJ64_002223 [Coemansia asiatica]